MSRSDLDRLHDARDFARHAQASAGGLSAAALADALQPRHAAFYAFVVMGEALSKVLPEIKSMAPDFPWRAIAGLRNIVVHTYWRIDLEIVADLIANKIDPLQMELGRLIGLLEGTGT